MTSNRSTAVLAGVMLAAGVGLTAGPAQATVDSPGADGLGSPLGSARALAAVLVVVPTAIVLVNAVRSGIRGLGSLLRPPSHGALSSDQ